MLSRYDHSLSVKFVYTESKDVNKGTETGRNLFLRYPCQTTTGRRKVELEKLRCSEQNWKTGFLLIPKSLNPRVKFNKKKLDCSLLFFLQFTLIDFNVFPIGNFESEKINTSSVPLPLLNTHIKDVTDFRVNYWTEEVFLNRWTFPTGCDTKWNTERFKWNHILPV